MTTCDCLGKAPTYPTYRGTIHLPDCPWYQVEILERRVQELEELSKLKTKLSPPEPEYCYYKVKYCTNTVNHNCHMCREFNTRYKGRFN